MDFVIEPINALAGKLSRLPGIGSKSAQRLAFQIASLPEHEVRELSEAVIAAKKLVCNCSICGVLTQRDPCMICNDPARSSDTLCVVKETRDMLALERTREYKGRYHILGGVISPMEGIGPDDIRIRELIGRIGNENVQEVVIATSLDIEGEATANYICAQLKPLGIVVSRIAYGVPVGGNLEYTDERTLMKALEGRRQML